MCLILFATQIHPDYPLVLAANRDEFHARPTRAAHWWEDCPELLAGQDLSAGGTWLGISRSGRLAAVTNYRDPASHDPLARSRGSLPTEFLCNSPTARDFGAVLESRRTSYNGFNLLFGSVNRLHYFSNRGETATALEPGIYGLSNHLLDTPWPKVRRGKQALAAALQRERLEEEKLWRILADSTPAPDDQLPETGISLSWERTLSAININGDHYGTRASTLLLVTNDGLVTFAERTLHPNGTRTEARFRFKLQTEPA